MGSYHMSHMTFAIISVSTGFDLIETNGCDNISCMNMFVLLKLYIVLFCNVVNIETSCLHVQVHVFL